MGLDFRLITRKYFDKRILHLATPINEYAEYIRYLSVNFQCFMSNNVYFPVWFLFIWSTLTLDYILLVVFRKSRFLLLAIISINIHSKLYIFIMSSQHWWCQCSLESVGLRWAMERPPCVCSLRLYISISVSWILIYILTSRYCSHTWLLYDTGEWMLCLADLPLRNIRRNGCGKIRLGQSFKCMYIYY